MKKKKNNWKTIVKDGGVIYSPRAYKKYSSRGKFVLKASNCSRSIKKTSNNKKNLVASFLTLTEAFQGS